MKTKTKSFFPLSVLDSEYFNDKKSKIELVSCSHETMKCTELLFIINKNYHNSDIYLREKDFQQSIEKLKNAYYKTLELGDVQCKKCTELFRSTITDSLKGIKEELSKLTTGIFGNKHYIPSYILVDNTLREFEELQLRNAAQQKMSKQHFRGSYLEKRVS